jgi:exopolyphosphatase/guanosine-5'-triphosphate,3'-diphosphate pyrophosphatase
MITARRAVLDVGTNSVKLLVADVAAEITPVWEESRQTRLGQGFYETHQLSGEAIARTARAAAELLATARSHRAEVIRIVATSAARDAQNAGELTTALEAATGLRLEIISGEQEADWVFDGVTTDPALARQPVLLLDVGGGSTEFILGQGHQKHFRHSFRLGTVRLLETIPHSDPPSRAELAETRQWVETFLRDKVQPLLDPPLERESRNTNPTPAITLVGTGGTATILARLELRLETFDRSAIEQVRITLPRLQQHMETLWSLPLARRESIVGLPRKRADVILPGVVIFATVMKILGFGELRISTRGLRFGAVAAGA